MKFRKQSKIELRLEENSEIKIISIADPNKNWIGNILINLENLEVEERLKEGYSIMTKSIPLKE